MGMASCKLILCTLNIIKVSGNQFYFNLLLTVGQLEQNA